VIVEDQTAFATRYNTAGMTIAGEYSGNLSNDGEKVKLFAAATPEANGYIPYYRADYVNYNDNTPWPTDPDGGGPALGRIDAGQYGNDVGNWSATANRGTPGSQNTYIDTTPPTVPAGLAGAVGVDPDLRIELTWDASSDPQSYVDHYVIHRDGLPYATTAVPEFTDTNVQAAEAHDYRIAAVNRDGYASAFSAAVDVAIPGIELAWAVDMSTVHVRFTEPVEQTSAQTAANYTISGLAVQSAQLLGDGVTVALTTSVMTGGTAYVLAVADVATVSGSPLPPGVQAAFVYATEGSGTILREWWSGIWGRRVSDLTSNSAFPNSPDGSEQLSILEGPTDAGSRYGSRYRGYLHPPLTGHYTFWIASDDHSDLYLSTDQEPAGATRIAYVNDWTMPREWSKFGTQQSAPVYLVAGRRYYIEVLHKESFQGDNLAVGWQLPDGVLERPIPGRRLSPWGADFDPPSVTVDPLVTVDPTPELTGTVDDNTATVIVTVDGRSHAAINLHNGTWRLPDGVIDPPLAPATYDVQATASDPAGNVGIDTTTNELTVEIPPPAITVDELFTSDRTPPLTGTINDPQATIVITVTGTEYNAVNYGDGTWELADGAIRVPLAEGAYDVQAAATNPAGATGHDATTDELTIDTAPPTVAVDSTATDDAAPALSGTVDDPAATVVVTVQGQAYEAVNAGDGTWRLPAGLIDPPLSNGTYDVAAAATDRAGNVGTDGTVDELYVDLTPPSVPGDLAAAAVTSTRIDLTWQVAVDGESGVSHYVIYRNGQPVDTSAAPAYSDVGLDQTQVYTYRVSAVSPYGFEGGLSQPAEATPRPGLVSVESFTSTLLLVTFGKPVEQATAETALNYSLTDAAGLPVPVASAQHDAAHTHQVTLLLAEDLVTDEAYTLTVADVEDLYGNAVEDGSQAAFIYREFDPSLLARWTFDDQADPGDDVSDNEHDLEVFGADWTADGRFGGAMQFDGSAGDYLLDDDGEAYLNGLSAFTVAMWVKADAVGTDRGFFTSRDPGRYDCINLRYDASASVSGAANTVIAYVSSTVDDGLIEGPSGVQTTDWQHVALTWSAGVGLALYLDGALQTPTFVWDTSGSAVANCTKVILGKGEVDSVTSWLGMIDEARIYSRRLAGEEIESLARGPDDEPPVVTGFERNDGMQRPSELTSVSLSFSQDVSASLEVSDLSILNRSTDRDADLSGATIAYDGQTNTARWDLAAVAFEPGYHKATLAGAGVVNTDNVPLAGSGENYVAEFLVAVPADADLDGQVGYTDYQAARDGFGQPGDWSTGDCNFDGVVDRLDYLLLKKHFGTSVIVAPGLPAAQPSPSAAPHEGLGDAAAAPSVHALELAMAEAAAGPPRPLDAPFATDPAGDCLRLAVAPNSGVAHRRRAPRAMRAERAVPRRMPPSPRVGPDSPDGSELESAALDAELVDVLASRRLLMTLG